MTETFDTTYWVDASGTQYGVKEGIALVKLKLFSSVSGITYGNFTVPKEIVNWCVAGSQIPLLTYRPAWTGLKADSDQ